MDELYGLDYEDMIGDMTCRFKYRQVAPNDYGLSTDDIINTEDGNLAKLVSLKKLVSGATSCKRLRSPRPRSKCDPLLPPGPLPRRRPIMITSPRSRASDAIAGARGSQRTRVRRSSNTRRSRRVRTLTTGLTARGLPRKRSGDRARRPPRRPSPPPRPRAPQRTRRASAPRARGWCASAAASGVPRRMAWRTVTCARTTTRHRACRRRGRPRDRPRRRGPPRRSGRSPPNPSRGFRRVVSRATAYRRLSRIHAGTRGSLVFCVCRLWARAGSKSRATHPVA